MGNYNVRLTFADLLFLLFHSLLVVKYYNLESFNQKIWIEDPTDTAESVHQLPKAMMKAGPIGRKASIGGPNPTSSSTPNDKTQPQKVKTKIIEMAKNMAAAEAADLVDPLGLNETLYRYIPVSVLFPGFFKSFSLSIESNEGP